MKRPLLLILVAATLLHIAPASAQEPVTLTFSDPMEQESETVRLTARLQRVHIREVLVTGHIQGRPYSLQTVRVVGGREQRTPPTTGAPVPSDTLRLLFAAQPVGKDSVNMLVRTPGFGSDFGQRLAHADDAILLETRTPTGSTTADAIPVMALSRGEHIVWHINGESYDAQSYCNVRDAALHPAKWYERFKLDDYIYFELRFSDALPSAE